MSIQYNKKQGSPSNKLVHTSAALGTYAEVLGAICIEQRQLKSVTIQHTGAGLVLIQGYSTEYPKFFATKFIYIVYITCICIKIENKGISKRILKF